MVQLDKVFFKSKAISKLSSDNLKELQLTISQIEEGKQRLKNKIDAAKTTLHQEKSALSWINWFPLKQILRNKVGEKQTNISEIIKDINELENEYDEHTLGLEISLPDQLEAAFGTLDDRFTEILAVNKVWDITTSQTINSIAERTTANNLFERKEIAINKSQITQIKCDYKAFHFKNSNGGNLNLFPQFLFIENNNDFALIDLLDIDIDFSISHYIENENVPSDTDIVEYTWAKSNKDGSRDKRFTDNYQIPVVRYGLLHFRSSSGLNEVYMFSHPIAAYNFKVMFDEYKSVLSSS